MRNPKKFNFIYKWQKSHFPSNGGVWASLGGHMCHPYDEGMLILTAKTFSNPAITEKTQKVWFRSKNEKNHFPSNGGGSWKVCGMACIRLNLLQGMAPTKNVWDWFLRKLIDFNQKCKNLFFVAMAGFRQVLVVTYVILTLRAII